MGAMCGKQDVFIGEGVKLGSGGSGGAPPKPTPATSSGAGPGTKGAGRTLGGGGGGPSSDDRERREAMAKAAEERGKASATRGGGGKLSANLAAQGRDGGRTEEAIREGQNRDEPLRMLRLVPDVLPHVFAHLPNATDVLSCALVCSEWRAPAQKALLGDLSFTYSKPLEALIATLRTTPHLRPYLTTLELHVDPTLQNPHPPPVVERSHLESLYFTPSLRELSILNLVNIDDETRPFLQRLPNLRSFYISTDNAQEIDSISGDELQQLILGWPKFRQLKLKGCVLSPRELTPSTPSPPLTHVDFFGVRITDAQLEWIVGAGELQYFRHMEVGDMPASEMLGHAFSRLFGGGGAQVERTRAVSKEGLVRAFRSAGERVVELHLGVISLDEATLSSLLPFFPNLHTLGVPITAIGPALPLTLHTFQLYQLPEAAPQITLSSFTANLRTCSFGSVEKVVISRIYTAPKWNDEGERELRKAVEERGAKYERADRYFHEW
ncbi:hypothetical protein MNV49_000718 [Pseudohyphozyma bogoriensis]|nr:hypothetical protein MNV49_000718 [Pseudohyphozyma bogoriensis]